LWNDIIHKKSLGISAAKGNKSGVKFYKLEDEKQKRGVHAALINPKNVKNRTSAPPVLNRFIRTICYD
jgi:hypothetical protein